MEEKFMRVLVMFDMPTSTKEDRKASAKSVSYTHLTLPTTERV